MLTACLDRLYPSQEQRSPIDRLSRVDHLYSFTVCF